MATNTTFSQNTYAGEEAGKLILNAFLANDTLQHVTVKQNIPFKQVVRKLVNDISFADPTCNFTDTGEVVISERVLELKSFQVQRTLCKADFYDTWGAKYPQNGQLDPNVLDAMIASMLGGIADKNENLVWTGDSGNTGEYDGFITLIANDGNVNFVSTPLAIVNGNTGNTNANILVALRNLITECPIEVKSATEKPKIYMSYDCWEAYLTAQIAAGNGWYATAGPEVPKLYMGRFEIAVCPGMPTSTMVMAQASNLWFGTNTLDQWNNITVVDMGQFAEKNVRFSADFFAGVQYGTSSEIAAYGPGLS